MEQIIQWDQHLFSLINGRWYNAVFDFVLPIMRDKYSSIPLYLFLLIYIIVKRKGDKYWWLVFAGAVPILADFVSSKLIKKNIWRARPCADETIGALYRNVINYCPEHSSSFTSSHAANHMAMAVFFYLTLHKFIGRWAILFFVWALSIMYAQVYVGVHFPIDVICGGIVGALIGWFVASLFAKNNSLT